VNILTRSSIRSRRASQRNWIEFLLKYPRSSKTLELDMRFNLIFAAVFHKLLIMCNKRTFLDFAIFVCVGAVMLLYSD